MSALTMKTIVDADHTVHLMLPDDFPVGPVNITVEPIASPAPEDFKPQTELGKRLWEIRQRAIAKGMKLLTQDEVLEEVRRRRGELDD